MRRLGGEHPEETAAGPPMGLEAWTVVCRQLMAAVLADSKCCFQSLFLAFASNTDTEY